MSTQPGEQSESAHQTSITEEQAHRASFYALIAALFRAAPDKAVLDYIARLEDQLESHDNELLLSLSMLILAAKHSEPPSLNQEYHDLFIGLGRGELVPYGSWYQTGYLNEKPLSLLRSDLRMLGFARAEDVHEPEDHIAALLEVMVMLIQEGVDIEQQQAFFEAHIASWAETFLNDLSTARHAVLYKAVARFALAFLQIETRYLSLLD